MQEPRYITDFTAIGRLNNFKRIIDERIARASAFDPLASVNYRKRGGLHFATLAGVNLSWSFKRKARKPAPEAPIDQRDACVAEISEARRKLARI